MSRPARQVLCKNGMLDARVPCSRAGELLSALSRLYDSMKSETLTDVSMVNAEERVHADVARPACIVGVGETAYTRGAQKSVLRLVLEASRHAMLTLAEHTRYGRICAAWPVSLSGAVSGESGINDLRYSTCIQMEAPARSLPCKALPWLCYGYCHARARALGWNAIEHGQPP